MASASSTKSLDRVDCSCLPADGTGISPTSVTPPGHYHPLTFSRDGQFLISTMIPANRENWKLLHGPLGADDDAERPLRIIDIRRIRRRLDEPDGRWLAHQSMATGTSEIWVRLYPGPGSPVRVSSNRGHEPIWNRNGRVVLPARRRRHERDRGHVPWRLCVTPAVRLFGVRGPLATQPPSYDVTPDGSFLMMKAQANVRAPLEVVLNWRGMIGQRAAVATEH